MFLVLSASSILLQIVFSPFLSLQNRFFLKIQMTDGKKQTNKQKNKLS